MKDGERITLEPGIATDLRTVASAAKLAEVYRITQRDGTPLSRSQEIDLLRNAIVGALVCLWGHAEKHIQADNTLELSSQSVDALVRLEGFAQAVSRQWLDEFNATQVVLPGYREKNALIAMGKRHGKRHPRNTAALGIDDYSQRHDGYSTTSCVTNSDYIPSSPAAVQNLPLQQAVSSEPVSGNPVLEVGLLYVGDGEKGSKSKRGCGGERERGEEGKDRGFSLPASTPNITEPLKGKKGWRALPQDFALTEAMGAYARQRLPDSDVNGMFQDFCAHHRSYDKRMKDWVSAWRTWVGNAQRFGYPKLAPSKSTHGLPVLNG